jgi:hypothetical protein
MCVDVMSQVVPINQMVITTEAIVRYALQLVPMVGVTIQNHKLDIELRRVYKIVV